MIILPLNADLSLGRWPVVTLGVIVLCLLIHYAQVGSRGEVSAAAAGYCQSPTRLVTPDPLQEDKRLCWQLLSQLHQSPDVERALAMLADDLSLSPPEERNVLLASVRSHYDRFSVTAPRSLDAELVYDPAFPNPIRMITSALAHADWLHVIFNMIFFFAFAASVELIVASTWRFVLLMAGIALATDLSYSVFAGIAGNALPTLGFSGVVMGMIGLAAYLIPHARIRTFVWVIFYAWTFFVPVWLLAAWFASWDLYRLLTEGNGSGVNFLAHVTGALAGYLLGRFWLAERKADIQEELHDEIEWMRSRRNDQLGMLSSYTGGHGRQAREEWKRAQARRHEETLQRIYELAELGRHHEASAMLVDGFDTDIESEHGIRDVHKSSRQWPLSPTTLNIARIYVDGLCRRRRFDQALDVCEACLRGAPEFVLGDPAQVLTLAEFARQSQRHTVALALVRDVGRRYAGHVDPVSAQLLEARLMWEDLDRPDDARSILRELLAEVNADRRPEVLRIARLLAAEGSRP